MEICTSVKKHRHCLYLLFKAVFACFPDRDYCITSLPTSSPLCYLVQHFARVIPKPNSTFSHELYVLHKSAILGQLSVRVATSEDTAEFNDIVKSIEKFHEVQNLFKEAVDNSSNIYKPYVFFCENQIIGAASNTTFQFFPLLFILYFLKFFQVFIRLIFSPPHFTYFSEER